MKKTLFVVALVVMSLVSFVSCEKDSATDSNSNSEESVKESIVGFWLGENDFVYVFYDDGSFSLFSGERGNDGSGTSGGSFSGTSGGSFSGTSGGSFSGTSGGSFGGDYGYELYSGYWKYDNGSVIVDMYAIPGWDYHIQCEVIDITSKSLTIVYEGNETVKCYRCKD
ncbi:MAG: hypothetical protein KBT04_06525 [Bacteroidales bacterium]|nr:hypothetical protein [Candidatus Colimorpha onthohippi]